MAKKINFEKSLIRLEEIIDNLEEGNIDLDNAVKLYDEGTKLANDCMKQMETIERKVYVLKNGEKEKISKEYDEDESKTDLEEVEEIEISVEEDGKPKKKRKTRKKKESTTDDHFELFGS